MNRRTTLLSAAIAASLLSSVAVAGDFRTAAKPIEGQYIVVLKEDQAARVSNGLIRSQRASDVAAQMASSHRFQVTRNYEAAVRGFVAKADDAALAKLLADPRVDYVEEDGIVSIDATQSGATWGLDRVHQRNLPLDGTYVYNRTATNVHAYIIDTGVLLSHSQFSGRMSNGYDAVTAGGNANDCNGHGTHVAGTVGGTTYGVAKGDAAPGVIHITFKPNPPIEPMRIIELIQKNRHIKLAGNEKLRIERALPEVKDRVQMVRDVLRSLGQPVLRATAVPN